MWKQANSRPGQTLGNMSFGGTQLSMRGGNSNEGPQIGRPQTNQFEHTFGGETLDSPNAHSQHKQLADMTDSERYGLPGLLSMIPLESPDHSLLAVGQDLTMLGLELSRPE
jgi:CCR4-NOT transcription complex subunit 2